MKSRRFVYGIITGLLVMWVVFWFGNATAITMIRAEKRIEVRGWLYWTDKENVPQLGRCFFVMQVPTGIVEQALKVPERYCAGLHKVEED